MTKELKNSTPSPIVFLAALLVGCGGGGNGMNGETLEGLYMVTSHTRNDVACDMEGSDVTGGNPYFRLVEEKRFGNNQLSFYGCSAPETCLPAPSTTLSGTMMSGDSWTAEFPSVVIFPGSNDCELAWTSVSIDPSGSDVRIESTADTGSVVVASDTDCVNDLVSMNMSMLMCTQFEVIVGTPLEI